MTLQVVRTADPLTARVRHLAVVWWTGERKAAVPSLDVVAGLGQRAVMGACSTLIDISARASIWRHGVSIFRTGTLVTARNIHALIGAQMADALGTLVDVFTGVPILPEVVALSAVALVGTIDVGTLLIAWAGQTLIHIFTVLPISG